MIGYIITGVSGTLTFEGAIRYMDREDEPGQWNDLGGGASPTANLRHNSGALPVTPGTVMLAQAGVKVTTAARGDFAVLVAGKY
jgi:hypothetical protein